MNKAAALISGAMAALAVTACTEVAVQDLLGSGKSAVPDSSQVRVGQNLSMPPDLQLRAPVEGAPDNTQQVAAVQPVQPVEPVAGTATQAQPVPQPLTGTQAGIQTAAAQPANQTPEQIALTRYGISKNYPDGKPKPDHVYYKELRNAQLAEKRRANPSYGSIWNMGELWSD